MNRDVTIQEKLDKIIEKTTNFSQKMDEKKSEDESEIVCVWGYLESKKGEEVTLRIGDVFLIIKSQDILDIEEADLSLAPETAREVFVKLKETAEITITIKQGAKLIKMGNKAIENIPFALIDGNLVSGISDEELSRQQKKFEKWQQKIGLFQKFIGSQEDIEKTCTMRMVDKWCSAGIGDLPVYDGQEARGCEGY